MLLGKKKEISYSPGRLARRLGISRMSLMNHLHETGLINRCYRDDNDWWRIPYGVAMEIAGPEALAVELPKQKPRGRTVKKSKLSEKEDAEWDEYVSDLMGEKKRQPPMSSRERRMEEARRQVDERFRRNYEFAVQLTKLGVTPQTYLHFMRTGELNGLKAEAEK